MTDGSTALGGDARTGCAVIVAMVETLLKHRLPHPPLTLLFTVREESGLHGARELDPQDLGGARMCFNVDATHANKLTIAAVGQENWEVEIKGKASHAGVAPEQGISATLVGSIALADAHRAGWFGKLPELADLLGRQPVLTEQPVSLEPCIESGGDQLSQPVATSPHSGLQPVLSGHHRRQRRTGDTERIARRHLGGGLGCQVRPRALCLHAPSLSSQPTVTARQFQTERRLRRRTASRPQLASRPQSVP